MLEEHFDAVAMRAMRDDADADHGAGGATRAVRRRGGESVRSDGGVGVGQALILSGSGQGQDESLSYTVTPTAARTSSSSISMRSRCVRCDTMQTRITSSPFTTAGVSITRWRALMRSISSRLSSVR